MKSKIKPLSDKTVILGISASIAAYKAPALSRLLTKAGCSVETCFSENAEHFIGAETLRGLTGNIPYAKTYGSHESLGAEPHLSLAERGGLFVVCPASASTIAKLSQGLSNDPLSLTYLSYTGPSFIVPSMATEMWENSQTKENCENLKSKGATLLGPVSGPLASGKDGFGRMLEPTEVYNAIVEHFGRVDGFLKGKSIVITAGGTKERIDPVRYISNDSSGKMGHALAEVARDFGAEVLLISSSDLETPSNIKRQQVESASEMHSALEAAQSQADILIMAAAVADFRPTENASHKIKKSDFLSKDSSRSISIVENADIVASVTFPTKIAFAAETEDLVDKATSKLKRKNLDMIVANDVTKGVFGSETNSATLIFPDGTQNELPKMSKYDLAYYILRSLKDLKA